MASASTLVSTTDNKSGQCPRPPRLRPSPPDDRQSIDNDNNNNNNRMTNPRINTIHSVVIVSDTGPPPPPPPPPPPHPPIPNSARKNPSSNCNSSERTWWPRWGFSFSSKFSRQSVGDRWLALILLLVMLSALPNSCSSAATIHHYPQSPVTGRGGRGSGGPHRHHNNNNNLPSTTTTASRILNECPWLEWESNSVTSSDNNVVAGHEADVAGTRAYMAPVVFEGKARSRSDGPVYRVTFDVVTVYKGEVALTGSQVRLEFKSGLTTTTTTQPAAAATAILPRSKSLRSLSHNSRSRTLSAGRRISASNSNSDVRRQQGQQQQQQHHHHRRHQHHNTRECLVTAEIRTGRRYLVFAAHWGPNNFTAFGSPLVHTKKSLKDVRSTLCPRCGESLSLSPSTYRVAQQREKRVFDLKKKKC